MTSAVGVRGMERKRGDGEENRGLSTAEGM